MAFNEIISMQDMRTSLADIADRVEAGAQLLVVRNSKPAFMLVPLGGAEEEESSRNLWNRIDQSLGQEPEFSESDIVAMVKSYRRSKAKA